MYHRVSNHVWHRGVAITYIRHRILRKNQDGRHLCKVKTINWYNFWHKIEGTLRFKGLPGMPESSLSIALLVKFKMAPFAKAEQSWIKVLFWLVVNIHHPKSLYWRGGRAHEVLIILNWFDWKASFRYHRISRISIFPKWFVLQIQQPIRSIIMCQALQLWCQASQQTEDGEPMSIICWPNVVVDGEALKWHWLNVFCLLL